MKYFIDYLESVVAPQISNQFHTGTQEALQICSKALLFLSYQNLKSTYLIDENNRIFDNENLQNDVNNDIANRGFFFSEYILSESLKIDIELATTLKSQIDYNIFQKLIESRYDGNIGLSSSSTIDNGIEKVLIKESQRRCMAQWPLNFYFKYYENIVATHFDKNQKIDAMVCDALFFEEPEYFIGKANMLEIIDKIILKFRKTFGIVILDSVIDTWASHSPWILKHINKHYSFLKIDLKNTSYYNYGYFFPKNSQENLLLNNQEKYELQKLTFGGRIKYFRNQAGFGQEYLAELIDVNPRMIRYYEADKYYPSISKQKSLCKALKINLKQLV